MKVPENQSTLEPARIRKKFFICEIILYSALTYFLILALLFVAGSVFSGKIINIIASYSNPEESFRGSFLWFAISGATVYLAASAGIILFILKRKPGFYIFFIALLAIFVLDFTFLEFDWVRYLIHSGFLFLLGIAHFSGKCYH